MFFVHFLKTPPLLNDVFIVNSFCMIIKTVFFFSNDKLVPLHLSPKPKTGLFLPPRTFLSFSHIWHDQGLTAHSYQWEGKHSHYKRELDISKTLWLVSSTMSSVYVFISCVSLEASVAEVSYIVGEEVENLQNKWF